MTEDEAMLVLAVMPADYQSKTVLMRELRKNVDDALGRLLSEGLIEGISLSGGEVDHFRLTEKGRRRRSGAIAVGLNGRTKAARGAPSGSEER
jgi:hypothetical protein